MSWTYNIAPPNGWKSFLLNQTPAHSLSEVSNFYRPCISGQCYLLPTARIREKFPAESNDKTNRWLINSGQGDGGGISGFLAPHLGRNTASHLRTANRLAMQEVGLVIVSGI